MSPNHDALAAAVDSALMAILGEIERRASSGDVGAGVQILNLAEAYAWLQAPDQPHGGRAPFGAGRPAGG